MHTTRRTFIKASALTAVGVAVLPKTVFATGKQNGMIGIQLYSIRDEMLKDPMVSLTQVAAMGYKNVEHANYINRKFYGYTAAEFKKVLEGLGLKMPSGHTVMAKEHWNDAVKDFSDSWKYTIEDAATLGQKYVISPWMDESMRKTADDLKRYMDVFNKCGELCKKLGMKFGYHNHDFEFSQVLGNEKVFDIIMKNIDPGLVALQLDIGNMYNAGVKAIDILNQYPGRFEIIHVKDEVKSTTENERFESTILGEGLISVKETLELSEKIGGTTCFIIEQEAYQGKSPMDCIKEDLVVMKKWGY